MYIDINIIDHRLTTNILTTTNGKWPSDHFPILSIILLLKHLKHTKQQQQQSQAHNIHDYIRNIGNLYCKLKTKYIYWTKIPKTKKKQKKNVA